MPCPPQKGQARPSQEGRPRPSPKQVKRAAGRVSDPPFIHIAKRTPSGVRFYLIRHRETHSPL